MYKHTTIFYPHIVKQYETIEQLVSENGYDDYWNAKLEELAQLGFDTTDTSKVFLGLSEDGFEGVATVAFASEAEWDSKQSITHEREYNNMKKPIFEEEFLGDSDAHAL